jgi:periplasmic protein TonB
MSSHQNSVLDRYNFDLPSQPLPRGRYERPRTSTSVQLNTRAMKAPDAIWGQYNNYRADGVIVSAIVHVVIIGGLLALTFLPHQVMQQVAPRQVVTLIAPSPETYALHVAPKVVSGGGGGGERSHIEAPKGRLPKVAPQQITPPAIVMHNEKPKLAAEPTVVAPPKVMVAENHMLNLGTNAAPVMPAAPLSNGTGSGGGIGSGSGGGVGVGHGAGVGAGSGGGVGGGVYHVGGGISAPTAVSTPDPAYTEEARKNKTQGVCVLWLIVDSTGRPRNIKVVRGLGQGLDAKAIEAVQQWHFNPALKDGHPVDVQISVEVGFKLY